MVIVTIGRMKEKCKDAARMRREKERTEFVELSRLLPLPSSTTSQLDKASIIRLTSSYLRMRTAFPNGLGNRWGTTTEKHHLQVARFHQQQQQLSLKDASSKLRPIGENFRANNSPKHQIKELGSLILQTLDGFVFAMYRDGKIMYISENASVHLGLPQIDLTGSSIFDYVHPTDCNDLNELFNLSEDEKNQLKSVTHDEDNNDLSPLIEQSADRLEFSRSFSIRMKCILPKRNAGLVNNGYKTIHCSGYLKVRYVKGNGVDLTNSTTKSNRKNKDNQHNKPSNKWEGFALVAVGHSLLPTATTEIKLGTNSFMFRASLNLKLDYIEMSLIKLLGYEPSEIIGQSLYQLIHVDDANQLAESHRLLLSKGQAVTKYYRIMRRNGGFIWLETHAALVNNPRNVPKPNQHIVGIFYVIAHNQLDESRLLSQEDGDFQRSNLTTSTNVEYKLEFDTCDAKKFGKRMKFDMMKKSHHTDARPKKNKTSVDLGLKELKTTMPNGGRNKIHSKDHTKDMTRLKGAKATLVVGRDISPQVHEASINVNEQQLTCNTIGSTRRPSDDSCSIVSNTTSTSTASDISLSNVYNHQLGNPTGTTINSTATDSFTFINYNHSPIKPITSNGVIFVEQIDGRDDNILHYQQSGFDYQTTYQQQQHAWSTPLNSRRSSICSNNKLMMNCNNSNCSSGSSCSSESSSSSVGDPSNRPSKQFGLANTNKLDEQQQFNQYIMNNSSRSSNDWPIQQFSSDTNYHAGQLHQPLANTDSEFYYQQLDGARPMSFVNNITNDNYNYQFDVSQQQQQQIYSTSYYNHTDEQAGLSHFETKTNELLITNNDQLLHQHYQQQNIYHSTNYISDDSIQMKIN